MDSAGRSTRTGWYWGLCIVIGFVAGATMRLDLSPAESAWADQRRTPERQQFLSGGARSEIVLREIAATLEKMDARLARIEKVAVQTAGEKWEPAPRNVPEPPAPRRRSSR